MDQISLFGEDNFWIPEINNSCRLWRCPNCMKAYVGDPIGWYQWKLHKFCSYCGARLFYPKINDGCKGDGSDV